MYLRMYVLIMGIARVVCFVYLYWTCVVCMVCVYAFSNNQFSALKSPVRSIIDMGVSMYYRIGSQKFFSC